MRFLYAILYALIFCLGCSSTPEGNHYGGSFLVAGQSNAVGAGRDGVAVNGTHYRYYLKTGREGNVNIRVGAGTEVAPVSDRFGPELGFAQEVPGVSIIKFAASGTPIEAFTEGGNLYTQFVECVGDEHVDGLLWIQGEGNANNLRGPRYEEELQRLGEIFSVPIAIVQLHKDCDRFRVDLVRKAQENFAERTGACLVNIDDLELKEDSVHWTTETQLEAGRRLADCGFVKL